MAAEAIEMLIELVREREFIYNAKYESHMDATMLANVWESTAKTMNVEGMDGEFIYRIQYVVNNQYRPSCAWCMSSACSFTFYNLDTGTNLVIAARQSIGVVTVHSVKLPSMSRDNIGSKSLRLSQAPYRYGMKKRIFIIRTIGA